jgi:hypothetical protein
VDAHGVPLSLIVTAANHHDVTQLEPVLNEPETPKFFKTCRRLLRLRCAPASAAKLVFPSRPKY